MIDRQKLIDGYPIADYIRKQGIELKPKGKELVGLCPFHADKNPSMNVNTEKGVYHCFTCGAQGSVIDFAMNIKQMNIKDTMYALATDIGLEDEPKSTTTYEYKDRHGRPVMVVDRVQQGAKKHFCQSRIENGKKVSGIEGIERVLFRCEKWHNEEDIEICEGEKCVQAFEDMGYHATCNAGGAASWLDSYAVYMKDKHVTIWPDRDNAGEKWCEAVFKSLGELPKSIRICKLPAPYNDVADVVIAKGLEIATEVIGKIAMETPRIERGHDIPIYSSEEIFNIYRNDLTKPNPIRMDLGRWMPALLDHVRPLIPGDVIAIIAGTGVGKTSILQNILAYGTELPSLLFELELSDYLIAERQAALANGMTAIDVEKSVLANHKIDLSKCSHIWTCPVSGMTVERMTDIIERAELKMGHRPKVIGVDYLQLMKGGIGKRYERMSDIAESMRVIAKQCDVILFMLSQISRKQKGDEDEIQEVYLDDGKDSGSIESSSSLVLGAWKENPKTMWLKILKNSRGTLGDPIECAFDGARYRVKQKIHGVN